MMTSGAPEPASIEVENLVYSSLPWPALVQQTWTSSCVSLNRSTTCSNAGYQAQTLTWGASATLISLVQLAASDSAEPDAQPVRAAAARAATPVAARSLRFIGLCSFLSRCGTPLSVCDLV